MSAAKPQDCTLCSHVALYLPWHTGMVPGAWSYLPAAAETLGLSAMNVLRSGSKFKRTHYTYYTTTHGGMGGLVSPSMGFLCDCEIFVNLRLKI